MNIFTINNKFALFNNKALQFVDPVDPYNPLGLPPNTVRVRTSDGNEPDKIYSNASYETASLVPGTSDVYDVYKSGTSFKNLLNGSNNVIEVLGANTSGVINMKSTFHGCNSLTSIPLFDTSKVTDMSNMLADCTLLTSVPLFDTSEVTDMSNMLANCTLLTSVPLFDTSKVTNMSYMCSYCTNVQSGALALYQQASSQANPPTNHNRTFRKCGSNTQTGAAELAQIPSSWGGTGA